MSSISDRVMAPSLSLSQSDKHAQSTHKHANRHHIFSEVNESILLDTWSGKNVHGLQIN